jgi:hypothetical protein
MERSQNSVNLETGLLSKKEAEKLGKQLRRRHNKI